MNEQETEGERAYKHPESGRLYKEGDPACRFTQLIDALARQCGEFLHHYGGRLEGVDYLQRHVEWPSDPERVARAMAHTIAELDRAYTAVVVDRDLHTWGLGERDAEWHRKYGNRIEQ